METIEEKRCAAGHLMTQVRRPNGVRTVCLTCLSGAMNIANARAEALTVNDLVLGMESGEMPRLTRADTDGMTALLVAAKELHGGQGLDECRRVIRTIAKEKGLRVGKIMTMPAARLVDELDAIRTVVA